MMTTLDKNATRPSWILRTILAAGIVALLAMPLVYLTTSDRVQAKGPESKPDRVVTTVVVQERPEFLPPRSEREEAIVEKLSSPTKMDFVDTPLLDATVYLKDYHGMEIQLDKHALEEAGLGSDTPVNLHLEDVPLRSALRQLLKPHDLTFIIHNDVLLITTVDAAESLLVTRTYPVRDLIDRQPEGSKLDPYEKLTEVITSTIAKQSWDQDVGNGSIVAVPSAGSLVIAQTHAVHDEIVQLLRALRAARQESGE